MRSCKGVGPLASSDLRFKDKIYMRTPSPTRYSVAGTLLTKGRSKAPFGSNTKRMDVKENAHPGPGTYDLSWKKCRRTKFMYNFGHPSMVPSIEIFCISRPDHICIKCNQICVGDYWHKDHSIFLCHLCWEEEKRGQEQIYNQKELKTFKVNLIKNKIRKISY